MDSMQISSEMGRLVLKQLQADGYDYTFRILADCILCNNTDTCYPHQAFRIESMHAFGDRTATREMIYAIRFDDDFPGILFGTSEELNAIEEPELFNKLLLL